MPGLKLPGLKLPGLKLPGVGPIQKPCQNNVPRAKFHV